MPLVTSEQMLLKADKEGYAVGAFNVENMEMVMAVIKACESTEPLSGICSIHIGELWLQVHRLL